MDSYEHKYLKYKNKYIALRNYIDEMNGGSPDKNQLILNIPASTGYDDPQEFIDDVESEVGFPDYDFNVKSNKVYITKK